MVTKNNGQGLQMANGAFSSGLLTGGLVTALAATSVFLALSNRPEGIQIGGTSSAEAVGDSAPVRETSSFLWQKNDPSPPPPPPAVKRKNASHSWPTPKRIEAAHSEGKGIGFPTGYTNLSVEFAPYYEKGKFLPIVNIGAHCFDNGKWGGDVGLIYRYIPKEVPILAGLNAFYYYDQGRLSDYNALGVGLELLSTVWDFRFNGYIPVGQQRHFRKHKFKYPGGYEAESFDNETILGGFNAELGLEFLRVKEFFLYAAGGPYYLSGPIDTKTWGVTARLLTQYSDYVAVNLSISNDSLYGTIYRAELLLSLPLYNYTSMKKRSGPGGITNRQIYQPVRNFDPLFLNNKCCWKSNF